MRVPVHLDIELVRRAKERAEAEGTSIEEMLERTLRAHLPPLVPPTSPAPTVGAEPFRLRDRLRRVSVAVQPGVDLDDSKRLRDLMDGLESNR